MSPSTCLAIVLVVITAVPALCQPASSLPIPSPAPGATASPAADGADPSTFTKQDFASLDEPRLKKVVAAWAVLEKKLPELQSRADFLRAMASKGTGTQPEAFAQLLKQHSDVSKLESEIGMSWDRFSRDQALVLLVHAQKTTVRELGKADEESAKHREELMKMAEDPGLPAEQRQMMKQQIAEMEKLTREIKGASLDIPAPTSALVEKYAPQIKTWLEFQGSQSEGTEIKPATMPASIAPPKPPEQPAKE